jgi:hypothetical protein
MARATAAEMSTQSEDGLLTADEVATILQVTPAWVYAETRRRRIPHVVGGSSPLAHPDEGLTHLR